MNMITLSSIRSQILITILSLMLGAHAASAFVATTAVTPPSAFLSSSSSPSSPSTRSTFRVSHSHVITQRNLPLRMSSYTADGSEYSSSDSDYNNDEDDMSNRMGAGRMYRGDDEDEEGGIAPTIELQPVPMSKNSGNRFVAVIWDRLLHPKRDTFDPLDMHYDRIALTEDHVMFCRKANLYNETFNTDSMVDILWSRQILSTDLQRAIGHIMCMESTKLEYVQDTLSRDPIVQKWTGGDISQIPLYRWRHIRDYTLRQDDGRHGTPAMCLAFDNDDDDDELQSDDSNDVRQETSEAVLEYLMRSERVIATGPLHLPTAFKNDPSSFPVGDMIMFNAVDREDAINFVENLPSAQEGLYKNMKVYFYNNLDVTGKFVSEDTFRDAPCEQMKEALEYWGYPVQDEQTPWLNW